MVREPFKQLSPLYRLQHTHTLGLLSYGMGFLLHTSLDQFEDGQGDLLFHTRYIVIKYVRSYILDIPSWCLRHMASLDFACRQNTI